MINLSCDKVLYGRRIVYFSLFNAIIIGLKLTQIPSLLGFGSLYGILFYLWVFFVAIYTIWINGIRRTNILGWLFLAIGLMSLIFNDVNYLFQPWQRLGLFFMMFIGLGPLSLSFKSILLKYLSMKYLQYVFIVISLLSFLTYLLRMPFSVGKAGVKGITTHAMDLSPIAALAALSLLNMYFSLSVKKNRKYSLCLFIVSLLPMFIAASRGAIIGFFMSAILLFFCRNKRLGNLIKYTLFLSLMVSVLVSVNPANMMDGINKKFERTEKSDDITGGRKASTALRFVELEESPLIGCGFSSMKYGFVTSDGHFEPGSGWIFILSSTGYLGFLLVVSMFCKSLRNGWKHPALAFYTSVCCFFIIHTMIEGYSLTVGNAFCVIMWMNVGLLIDNKYLCNYD